MTKERSGTTPSPRTRSQRSLTVPSLDSWFRLPRGGPAGVGMQDISWRCLEKSSAVAVRQMGARAMVAIPQRRCSCTDTRSCVNLRRRGEPAGPQVWQKPQIRPQGFHPFPAFLNLFHSNPLAHLGCCRAKHYAVFVLSPSRCSYTRITNYSLC